MNTISKTIFAGLVLAGIAVTNPSWASDEARDVALKINDANTRLRGGDVDGAITAYQQASENSPAGADLNYNLAVAQYRKGDVAAAERLFQTVAAADDDTIAAKARYNLGNCNFAEAVRDAEKDRLAAIKGLESAIGNYRSALDVDSSDPDARANIERAAALIDKLKQEEKKEEKSQQQQPDSSKQKKQEQDKQDKSQDSQKSDSDQQQDQQENEKEDQKQGQNNQQQAQDQKPQQQQQQDSQSSADRKDDKQQSQKERQAGKQSNEEKSSQGKSEQGKSQQPKQSDAEQRQQEHDSQSPKEAQSQQSKSESQQDNSDDKSANDPQQKDAKSPQSKPEPQRIQQQQSANRTADQSTTGTSEKVEEGQGKTPPKGALSAGNEAANDTKQDEKLQSLDVANEGEMTPQEAEKMLQSIRDREMLRRLRRQAAERDRHVPVDRDW
jgi:hypothetical protein